MEIGFIGLGNMGGPMSRRLVEAGHQVTVFDTRKEAMEQLTKLGATAARSVADVADRVETVMTSLPSLDIGFKVAAGDERPHPRQPHQALRRSLDHRLARRDQDRRDHEAARHRADRLPGQRRRRRRREGHARGDGVRPEGRGRADPLRARSVRQGVLLRRQARHGAEHEARQQFPLGHRPGGDLRGDRDGRQGRPRSEPDGGRDQLRQRHEHLDHAEVSARDPAGHLRLRLRHGADGEGRAAVPVGGGIVRHPDRGGAGGRPAVGEGARRARRRSRTSRRSRRRSRRAPACRCAPRRSSGRP